MLQTLLFFSFPSKFSTRVKGIFSNSDRSFFCFVFFIKSSWLVIVGNCNLILYIQGQMQSNVLSPGFVTQFIPYKWLVFICLMTSVFPFNFKFMDRKFLYFSTCNHLSFFFFSLLLWPEKLHVTSANLLPKV